MSNEDFDFGFSIVDEEDLEPLQEARSVAAASADAQSRLDKMYEMIVPLLDNLQANPKKEYIYWPNRVEKIREFKDKLQKLHKG